MGLPRKKRKETYKDAKTVSDQHQVREFRGPMALEVRTAPEAAAPGGIPVPAHLLRHVPLLALVGLPRAPWRMCGFQLEPDSLPCISFLDD